MSSQLDLRTTEHLKPLVRNGHPPVKGRLSGQRIAVVGLGYVGLPTALALINQQAEVIGLDIDDRRIAAIERLEVELLPRDIARLTSALQRQPGLRLMSTPTELESVDAVIVCVPTPIDAHMTPDLAALSNACRTVVEHARRGQTIVLTSTTYVGCTYDLLVKPLQDRGFRVGRDIFVAFSPERIDPGVEDHLPERTPRVVGGYTGACGDRAAKFLSSTSSALHVVSSTEAAEMTKLLENTFRAVNIALANEFADAADEMGVNVMEVIEAASTKPYGYMPFYPGAGVGGHCIPCDPHYLLWQLRARRADVPVVASAMAAIAGRPRDVVAKARHLLGDHGRRLAGAKVLVVGVSYKPGVGDVRESPALTIIDMLAAAGAQVSYTDPYVETLDAAISGLLSHVPDPASGNWDLVIVHTLHPTNDHGWLARESLVLDTTYRLADHLADMTQ